MIELADCDNCPLQGRTMVPGKGSRDGVAVVGEAPGASEASRREPFVGSSGQILRATLSAAGLDPEALWITNACLCRPPANDTPTQDAIDACRPRLLAELKGINKVLICGNVPLRALTGEKSISKVRGMAFWLEDLKALSVATWHPAKCLYIWDDFRDFAKDVEKFSQLDPTPESAKALELPDIRICRNVRDVRRMCAELRESSHIVCDLETSGKRLHQARIVLITLQGRADVAWQVPKNLLRNLQAVKLLRDLLENPPCITAGHNAMFDAKFLHHYLDIDWRPTEDTMLMHYLLDERSAETDSGAGGESLKVHGLKTLAREHYNIPDYEAPVAEYLKRLRAQRKKAQDPTPVTYGDLPLSMLSPYAARDTQVVWLFLGHIRKMLAEDSPKLPKVLCDILMPASYALRDVESLGITIDVPYLLQLKQQYEQKMQESYQTILELNAGEHVNLNSPKQLSELLYRKLGLPQFKGNSTDRECLAFLANKHPVAEHISQYRTYAKLVGTYVDGILEYVDPDGRVRSSFLLHGTVSGRLSSRGPNLQNIPNYNAPEIRRAFVATPGWVLLNADYSQIEVRVAAWFGQDPALIEAYQKGYDIHRVTAAYMFRRPFDKVTPEQRQLAKRTVFAILYGAAAQALAAELKVSLRVASQYVEDFLNRFSGFAAWISAQHAQALSQGYVESMFGRKRRFPLVFNANQSEVMRKAVNSPIQSTASDLCLTALTRLHGRLHPEQARILLTVHDSIMVEVRPEYLLDTMAIMRHEMVDNIPLKAPLPIAVDFTTGANWADVAPLREEVVVSAGAV